MHPTKWISQRPFRLVLLCALSTPAAGVAQTTSGFATTLALTMEGNIAAAAETSFPPSSYAGRAVDLFVGDGNLRNPRTRAKWIAFRQWVVSYDGGRFRLIGSPDHSWDWPHVELSERPRGYGSIEALLRDARSACCTPSEAAVHWSHDPARSRAAALPRAGSGGLAVRRDGASGGTAVSAR